MIDIDHFKSINDRFGHEAGDSVIKSIAATIQRVVHDNGMAFRYGGEEFLVLLANTDEQAANRFATEIYNGVRELSLRFAFPILDTWMSLLASPVTRSTPRATTCYAPQMSHCTARKSWDVRAL